MCACGAHDYSKRKGNIMNQKKEVRNILIAGLVTGILGAALVLFGNPKNMGFCIACFLRDTAGALGLHRAEAVQYIRPEIIGLVLGSFIAAMMSKEFRPKGGSAPLTRFILGFFAMIGCLMFFGCPFRMVLRLAGGDLNAVFGLVGFVLGILCGIFFLNKGYSLKRTYVMPKCEGFLFPAIQAAFLILLVAAPAFILFSPEGAGPGALHAPIIISLIAGLLVGAMAQKTRLCMVGGIRDFVLFKDVKLLSGFVAVFAAALVVNLILTGATEGTYFTLSMTDQPVAHVDGLWNALGMLLAGFACTLLGGCPLRQLVLAGEGNTDSAVTVLGLMVGAAFAHNFGLASSGAGPTDNGKIAVIIGIVVVAAIGALNTFKKEN